jgi:hypothetical protein
MVLSLVNKMQEKYNLLISDIYFENVTNFKCLGTRVKNQNCIQEGIKSRLSRGMFATVMLGLLSSCLESTVEC